MGKTANPPHGASPARKSRLPYQDPKSVGWPRPFVKVNPEEHHVSQMPVPWHSEDVIKETGKFAAGFDCEKSEMIVDANFTLCDTCGEKIQGKFVYGLLNEGATIKGKRRLMSSGGAMHPRCALLAYKFCPHLQALAGLAANGKALAVTDSVGLDLNPDINDFDQEPDEVLDVYYLSEDAKTISLEDLKSIVSADNTEA